MTGFHQRGDDAIDADAVAAHDDRVQLFTGVEEAGPQRLGILRAQLEHVAHFDGMAQGHGAAAPRARIAVDGITQVGEQIDLEIPRRIHAGHVRLGQVGPGHRVGHVLNVAVGENGNLFLHPHRTGEADRRPVTSRITSGEANSSLAALRARRILPSLAS